MKNSKEKELLQELTNMLEDDATNQDERLAFSFSKQQLEKKEYFPKIVANLKSSLTPLAVNHGLSANGKKIYKELLDPKFANRGWAFGLSTILSMGR